MDTGPGPGEEEPNSKDKRPFWIPQSQIDAEREARLEEPKALELQELLKNYNPDDFRTLRPIREWFEETLLNEATKTNFVIRPFFLINCIARSLQKIDKKYFMGSSGVRAGGLDGTKPMVDFDAQMQYAGYRSYLARAYNKLGSLEFGKDETVKYYFSVFEVLSSHAKELNIWVIEEDAKLCNGDLEKLREVDKLGAWKTHGWDEMTEYVRKRIQETKGKDAKNLRTQKEFMSAVSGGVRKRRAVEKKAKKSQASAPADKKKKEHVIILEELDDMEITEEDYQYKEDAGYVSQDDGIEGDPDLGGKPQGDSPNNGEQNHSAPGDTQESPKDESNSGPAHNQSRDQPTGSSIPPDLRNSSTVRSDGEDVIIDEYLTAVFFKGRPVARRSNCNQFILAIGPRSSPIHRILQQSECNVDWDKFPDIVTLHQSNRRACRSEFHGMLRGISAVAFVDKDNIGPEAINPIRRKEVKKFIMPLTYVLLAWKDGQKTWESRSDCKTLSLPKRSSKEWDERIYRVAVEFQAHHERANPESEIFTVPNIKVEPRDGN
ncbi:hypothetical protein TWF481_010417 [Arthrobotrys musiformis]|uniref:FHA domain-containing protein n=1 Tax=Arthrobotrys musiformis TaxID=47236 RepID=A0AAV9W237_9PEZI